MEYSKTIIVSDVESSKSSIPLIAGGLGLIVLIVIITMFTLKRRRIADELELIESWDAFGRKPKSTSDSKDIPILEGGVIDGALEVQSEQENFDLEELLE